ncbi:hypothetical protein QUF50_08795 [Thiotrichales bacterium HSG1]|nr:hypothetical protein [Thiotrichales bacterium HSG1]
MSIYVNNMTLSQTVKYYPFYSPQPDFWFEQIFQLDVSLYNTGGYVRIEGIIDSSIFEKAFNFL